jgi:hypothetical protein
MYAGVQNRAGFFGPTGSMDSGFTMTIANNSDDLLLSMSCLGDRGDLSGELGLFARPF